MKEYNDIDKTTATQASRKEAAIHPFCHNVYLSCNNFVNIKTYATTAVVITEYNDNIFSENWR